jgi:indole-3-glycerol phosphate synthase
MSNTLTRILEAKREEVVRAKESRSLATVEREAQEAAPVRDFVAALRNRVDRGLPAVIAEIKRSSPSKGVIRPDLDVAAVARSYEANGAACLSVLTDKAFFGGTPEDLKVARLACGLPVLRKDFIVDPWQVFEARAMGADCILLIIGTRPPDDLAQLEALAMSLGMAVLVECHSREQLRMALELRSPLIGVNNRDLRTFETRLETTLELKDEVPADRLLIAESGIANIAHVRLLRQNGVSAYLVGSALMAADDPGQALQALFSANSPDA